MWFPWQLFEFDLKALSGSKIEVVTYTFGGSGATAVQQYYLGGPGVVSLVTATKVPLDRVWLVHNCRARLIGGGAQNPLSFWADDVDAQGNVVGPAVGCEFQSPLGGYNQTSPNHTITHVLQPGHTFALNAVFSAGVAVNAVSGIFQAFSIPRGKIALAGQS